MPILGEVNHIVTCSQHEAKHSLCTSAFAAPLKVSLVTVVWVAARGRFLRPFLHMRVIIIKKNSPKRRKVRPID